MASQQVTSFAAILCVAGAFGNATVHAQARELVPTVIVACDHSARGGGSTDAWTEVSRVQTAGRVPDALVNALNSAPPCAEAFNMLANGGFDLVHRLSVAVEDFNGDGDSDGRDFLIWQRQVGPAPSRSTGRGATLGVKCGYVVASTPLTRVLGVDVGGSVAAALAPAPGQSCAEAFAALAGAGFGLASGAPAPAPSGVDASDYNVWRANFGAGG